jgi:hypothetical protein
MEQLVLRSRSARKRMTLEGEVTIKLKKVTRRSHWRFLAQSFSEYVIHTRKGKMYLWHKGRGFTHYVEFVDPYVSQELEEKFPHNMERDVPVQSEESKAMGSLIAYIGEELLGNKEAKDGRVKASV